MHELSAVMAWHRSGTNTAAHGTSSEQAQLVVLALTLDLQAGRPRSRPTVVFEQLNIATNRSSPSKEWHLSPAKVTTWKSPREVVHQRWCRGAQLGGGMEGFPAEGGTWHVWGYGHQPQKLLRSWLERVMLQLFAERERISSPG